MTLENETVRDVVVRVLEEWALMGVDQASEEPAALFETNLPLYLASVQFRGRVRGEYFILCQQAFADALASSLLGEDGVGEDERFDALREMANVLGGNLLTECYGADSTFDVILPAVQCATKDLFEEYLKHTSVTLLADDIPVTVGYSQQAE
jgi:hypothetical protein